PLVDAVQHVEQQGLEHRGVGARSGEIKDLEALDRQRILDVVEEVRVSASFNPFAQPTGERSREEVRQGEETPLGGIEDVYVFDGFVQLPVFCVAQSVRVCAFEQHASERMQEVQVLRGW